ncbi:MAG: UDP-N-acetylglucosamine--N-acetylmuramyl-(pentapeptide) pyrophosphoryl-undecaprenol N-acetylglucosamine transferase [candidate division WOR-3 bacterium]
MNSRILIVAGGTGGHIYPAIAVAEAIRERNYEVIFVTRNNPGDIEIIKRTGIKYFLLPTSNFMAPGIRKKIISVFNMACSIFVFLKILWTVNPQFLIASGCYVSVIPLVWAVILKKQFYLLEQNAIPGRVVRYFSRHAREIFLGFPLFYPIKGKAFYSGNPLRKSIVMAAQKFNLEKKNFSNPTILILGGSQGAYFLNLIGLSLASLFSQLRFIIVTGKQHYSSTRNQVKTTNCDIIEYTYHPEKLYEKASIVITRAGAMVLSEILAFGLPAIIIPYPFAANNHQKANAQYIVQNKAGVILEQCTSNELSQFINTLKNILIDLLSDKNKLLALSKNALKLAKLDAADVIARRTTKPQNIYLNL